MRNEIYACVKGALAGGWMLVLLAGCGGGGGSSGDPAKEAPPDAAGRAVHRSDSAVTVTSMGSQFTATQTVTLSNDTAQKSKAVVQFHTPVGNITSAPPAASGLPLPGLGGGVTDTGYQITVTLNGHGDTEQKARDALATMSVEHSDAVTGDTLYLATFVHFAPADSAQRDAAIKAQLPAALSYRLNEGAQVGDASSTGLSGPYAEISTPVGTSSLQGTWSSAVLNSDSGNVSFNGSAQSLRAYSNVGSVTATMSIQDDLDADLASQVGSVDVGLTAPLASIATTGYDLYADADVGTATISVVGATAQGSGDSHHAHSRSANYDTASPKVLVHGASSVGSVTIHN